MSPGVLGALLPTWLALAACDVAAMVYPSASNSSPARAVIMANATVPPALVTPEESYRLAFEQAISADTNATLILFLAREQLHPWIEDAQRLQVLRRMPDAIGAATIGPRCWLHGRRRCWGAAGDASGTTGGEAGGAAGGDPGGTTGSNS
jgi:hypothetical protein